MMKRYRITQACIAIGLLLYVVVAYGTVRTEKGEFFPFFSWNLFSYVPASEVTTYGLRFTSANGETLDSPLYFEESLHLTVYAKSIDASILIQDWGRALANDESSQGAEMRQLFQSTYLGDIVLADYEMVQRTYNLIELWQHSRYKSENVIASYTFDKDSADE